jgi:hypothetical protein
VESTIRYSKSERDNAPDCQSRRWYPRRLLRSSHFLSSICATGRDGCRSIRSRPTLPIRPQRRTSARSSKSVRPNHAKAETDVFPESCSKRTSDINALTGIDLNILLDLGKQITELPSDLNPDPKVRTFAKVRWETIEKGAGINMATAEGFRDRSGQGRSHRVGALGDRRRPACGGA